MMRIGDQTDMNFILDAVQQAADERRLAGSHLSGDHHESRLLGEAVLKQGQRHLVTVAQI
jgi:hypothetical protein